MAGFTLDVERWEMANQHGDTYMYTFEAVREKAPSASGVYTIYTPRRWVFVGDSENIRLSLFRHLNEESASLTRFGPLSFSFELMPPAERVPRQKALVAALEPECQDLRISGFQDLRISGT